MSILFSELALVFTLGCALALALSKLKQPSIVGYIAAGAILGPFGFGLLKQGDILAELSTLGVALLLFLVGLELKPDELKKYGRNAVIAGTFQVCVTTAAGLGIALLLGFGWIASVYIALALTFSSTILVIKLLTEKRELQSLSGRLVIGIFLTQDLVALLLLIILSGTASGQSTHLTGLLFSLLKGIGFAFGAWWLGKKIIEPLLHKFGKSDELLLVITIGWGLGLAAVAASPVFGFSLEIGGFLAGLSLAKSSVQHQISARVRSLRDFFLVLFFFSLGSQLVWSSIFTNIWPAVMLGVFVLIGNPIIVLLILGKLGYRSRTAFLSAITVGQVSEFSLILATLGRNQGHIDDSVFALLALVSVGTIIISSYCITHSESLYKFLKTSLDGLALFHGNRERHDTDENELSGHLIIIGAHQMGTRLAEILHRKKTKFIVIDFDPEVIERLNRQGIKAICGDAADPLIQKMAQIEKARIIVSTLPQLQDNLGMLEILLSLKKRPKIIISCHLDSDAKLLYEHGADYCILPHELSSIHLGHILSSPAPAAKLKELHKKSSSTKPGLPN